MLGTLAIIGTPNVGKSTIFNRIVGKRKSIIDDERGVTRDRIYAKAEWLTKEFSVIDTGGIELENKPFQEQIRAQAEIAIKEADVILFIVDSKLGVTSDDKLVAKMLYKSKKPVILGVNKVDSGNALYDINEFYSLGLGDPIPVSGVHGIGIGDILDKVIELLPEKKFPTYDEEIAFTVIGRPNVGKSSLINALLNENRVIVSDVAGTTRDAIDTKFRYEGNEYTVIDTAGMRKKGHIFENVEKYSLLRSLKAMERSNVCVLVVDASAGISEHDKHILSYAIEAGKGVVIAVNKWDTVSNPDMDLKTWKRNMEEYFKFAPYAKVVYLSAKTKKRMHTLMPEIIKAYENNRKEIPTNLLNDCIEEAYLMHIAPSYKGKRLKIYFVKQTDKCPPKFTLQVNNKGLVHFSYERYLENELRKAFDLEGTPIILQFKNKGDE